MTWGAVIAGGVAVTGAYLDSKSAKDAANSQEDQLAGNQAFIQRQADLSTDQANSLYTGAGESSRQGFQGALDVMGQYMPQQASVFQAGNVGAQGVQLAGLQQQNNAIMGLPVDYSQLQPQTLSYDDSFMQQELPASQNVEDILDPDRVANQEANNAFISGLQSDLDLFNAAGFGKIDGLSTEDQEFWRHVAASGVDYSGTGMLGLDSTDRIMSNVTNSSFDDVNKRRLQRLLESVQGTTVRPRPNQGQNQNQNLLGGVAGQQAQPAQRKQNPLGGIGPRIQRRS